MPEPGIGGRPEGSFGESGQRDSGRGGAGGDRDIAERFRQTFGGGFLTDAPSFQRTGPGGDPRDLIRALLLGPGIGLGRFGQHLFTPNPDGTFGFTPPGGTAGRIQGRNVAGADPRFQGGGMASILQQLLQRRPGGGARAPLIDPTERIDQLMQQLQQSLSP